MSETTQNEKENQKKASIIRGLCIAHHLETDKLFKLYSFHVISHEDFSFDVQQSMVRTLEAIKGLDPKTVDEIIEMNKVDPNQIPLIIDEHGS